METIIFTDEKKKSNTGEAETKAEEQKESKANITKKSKG